MAGRIVKGVKWSALERFSVQIVQFVVSMVLARLLTPEMFGVVAIALVLINILRTINESGFGAALIQKLDRDDLDFSTIFVLNLITGSLLYLLLFLCAPLISQAFHNSELIPVVRLLGLNLIIYSFIVVQRAQLTIKVDFKNLGKASFVACILSGLIGIYSAYRGMGVYAIVIQSLLSSFINAIIISFVNKWKMSFRFSKDRLKNLFGYAYKLILARFINVIFQEMYSFVIGLFYLPSMLGLFNRAKSFEVLATNNITTIVQRVSVPIFCEQQKDYKQLIQTMLKFIRSTALLVYPLLFGLFVLAEPLIQIILSDKWLGCVWMLRVLCPVGLFFLISTFNLNVFDAIGRTDLALKTEVYKKVVVVIILLISVSISFEVLVLSQVIVAFIEFLINTYFVKKQINLRIRDQIKNVMPIIFSSLIMSVCVAATAFLFESSLLKLIFGFLSGVLSYSLVCYFFKIPEFGYLLKNIKSKI